MQRSGRDIKARNDRLVRSFGASVGLGGGGGEKIETLCGRPGEAGRGDGEAWRTAASTRRGAPFSSRAAAVSGEFLVGRQ